MVNRIIEYEKDVEYNLIYYEIICDRCKKMKDKLYEVQGPQGDYEQICE